MSKQYGSCGDMVAISIPSSLVNKIKNRIANDGFSSVPDYVTNVLREQLGTSENDKIADVDNNIAQIKERLRTLGYLE